MDIWQLLSIFGFGFVLGLEHALDPDHVVAVSTIVSQEKNFRKSTLLGMFWGAGHTATLLIVAMIVLLLKVTIPAKIALSFEFIVGIMLVILGINVFRKLFVHDFHWHRHEHDAHLHAHLHSHKESPAHKHNHITFAMGMVHGLAGSAALMLLVVATLTSLWQGIIYVLIFGLGSVLGMMIVSGLIGLPFFLTKNIKKLNRAIQSIAGIVSITLGVIIMYQIIIII
ncbi:MAG: sulfite exporter TauE/SafE family protein [bacterium]|nr:sulfite exporter TauE/SafE family protein [bacterium]